MQGVEIRIQRIATNATIRAVHIGDAGDALNVVPRRCSVCLSIPNANTEDVAGTLDAMSDAASRVSGGPGKAASGAQSEADEVIGEMRHAVEELHSSSESSISRLNEIAVLGTRLGVEVSAVCASFSAGSLFAQVVDRARGELDRIGAQAGGRSFEGDFAPREQLESLAGRYTMQMERDVHESVAQGMAIVAAPGEASELLWKTGTWEPT